MPESGTKPVGTGAVQLPAITRTMKAVSLWQPWASLWVSPAKVHETRHWSTRHRGPLMVHAAKRLITDVEPELEEILRNQFGHRWRRELPAGAIVGLVDLVDVRPTEEICAGPLGEGEECDRPCGDFSAGRYGWRRSDYAALKRPVPFRGRQSLFDVPVELVSDQIPGWIRA